MVEVPEFWWKREQTNGTEYIYISPAEQDGFQYSEKFYIGRYTATGTISNITSKSNNNILGNRNITQFRNNARTIGTDWGIVDILRWSLIQMLYLVEYADYDCQKTLGYGNVGSAILINTGTCDLIKDKSGYLTNDKAHGVVYRGMENLWGNGPEWLDGVNTNSYYAWICYDRSQYASNMVASPYVKMDYQDASSSDYIKTMGYDANNPAIQRAIELGGSNNSYCPDGFSSSNSTNVVGVGGEWNVSDYCGLWFYQKYGATDTYKQCSARLLYIPESEVN